MSLMEVRAAMSFTIAMHGIPDPWVIADLHVYYRNLRLSGATYHIDGFTYSATFVDIDKFVKFKFSN